MGFSPCCLTPVLQGGVLPHAVFFRIQYFFDSTFPDRCFCSFFCFFLICEILWTGVCQHIISLYIFHNSYTILLPLWRIGLRWGATLAPQWTILDRAAVKKPPFFAIQVVQSDKSQFALAGWINNSLYCTVIFLCQNRLLLVKVGLTELFWAYVPHSYSCSSYRR